MTVRDLGIQEILILDLVLSCLTAIALFLKLSLSKSAIILMFMHGQILIFFFGLTLLKL